MDDDRGEEIVRELQLFNDALKELELCLADNPKLLAVTQEAYAFRIGDLTVALSLWEERQGA